jgi:hypothetical protein
VKPWCYAWTSGRAKGMFLSSHGFRNRLVKISKRNTENKSIHCYRFHWKQARLYHFYLLIYDDVNNSKYIAEKHKLLWLVNNELEEFRMKRLQHILTFSRQAVFLCTTRCNIQKFYMLLTMYVCVLYGSQNKQQLLPYKTLRDWFL